MSITSEIANILEDPGDRRLQILKFKFSHNESIGNIKYEIKSMKQFILSVILIYKAI